MPHDAASMSHADVIAVAQRGVLISLGKPKPRGPIGLAGFGVSRSWLMYTWQVFPTIPGLACRVKCQRGRARSGN